MTEPSTGAPEVLLVDDDDDIVAVLTEVLEGEGYRVRVAHNGQEGLALLKNGYPQMVLLDVEMPVLSGPDMAMRMFVENMGRESIPILLCSGILSLSAVAARVGTPYYLGKPYALDDLVRLVACVLAERRAPTPQLLP